MKLTVMMDRSSNSSEHSPPLSDNVGAETWLQFWENEISSVSGKNLGKGLAGAWVDMTERHSTVFRFY